MTVLGADTENGEYAALLLKQNPAVSQLHLFGANTVVATAADLGHLDTR